jgi:hypothetical protein
LQCLGLFIWGNQLKKINNSNPDTKWNEMFSWDVGDYQMHAVGWKIFLFTTFVKTIPNPAS